MDERRKAKTGRARLPRLIVTVGAMLLAAGDAAPASALPPSDDTEDPAGVECVGGTTGSFSLAPGAVDLGQSVTVSWNVQVPPRCAGVTQTLNGVPVARAGSMSLQPIATGDSYALAASMAGATRTLGMASVTVNIPPGSTVNITRNHWVRLLIQALGTPGITIQVADHVEMDLSGRQTIPIARGVRLLGGRKPNVPGGRLYTRTFPPRLFEIANDDVRISGLRIDGGEMGVADGDSERAIGISIYSAQNIEIDNNEIYGWRGSAISVYDTDGRIQYGQNALTVRIHDNFIHHNQRAGGNGYGVETEYGAYALIEKNVFDWNRHAISSDGRPDTGYFAYRNLVLKNGGRNTWLLVSWLNTHMFDVHGREDCWGVELSCGAAGEYFDIQYNSMLYDAGIGFKLRGTPSIRADVKHNVFRHGSLWTSLVNDGALNQTEPGLLIESDNLTGVDESDNLGSCDFDGDGIDDKFFATGQTWWYSSAGTGHWLYLNTSTLRVSEVALGDVTSDGKCDVTANGKVSSGGTGPLSLLTPVVVLQDTSGQLAEWSIEGGKIASVTYPALVDGTLQWRGAADFDGDGRHDYLWQDATGQVAIWNMAGGAHIGEGHPGRVPAGWTFQGLGDFDGDRQSDIVWRDEAGQVAIWFKGDATGEISPAAHPGYENLPAPVDLSWQVKGIGDFNGDSRSDILWRHANGQVWIWHMTGNLRTGEAYPGVPDPKLVWTIQGLGDFDADGRSDILWRDVFGKLAIWFAGDATRAGHPSYQDSGRAVPLSAQLQGIADYNDDGYADILWRNGDGQVAIWLLEGGRFVSATDLRTADASWQIRGVVADAW